MSAPDGHGDKHEQLDYTWCQTKQSAIIEINVECEWPWRAYRSLCSRNPLKPPVICKTQLCKRLFGMACVGRVQKRIQFNILTASNIKKRILPKVPIAT